MYIRRVFTTLTTTVNHSSNAPSFARVILDLQIAEKWETTTTERRQQLHNHDIIHF